MKCYVHHESDAVGVCKFCLRGVCPACATEVGKVTACKDRCEQEVSAGLLFVSNAMTQAATSKRNRMLGPLILTFMGLACIGWASMDGAEGVDRWFGGIFILIALLLGFVQYRAAKQMR